jgi:UDP-glucose 4-epimerase
MRIAITGASGNSGSATLRGPDTEGGHQIVGIARRGRETRPDGADDPWVSADLTRGTCNGTLEGAFKGANAVVHLAWGLQPSHDLRYLEELGDVLTSRHSAHEAAARRLLSVHERAGEGSLISRIRPTIVGQRSTGNALLRRGLPTLIPGAVVRVHERYGQPPVHRKNRDMVENVADAIARKLERRWAASNLAADPVGQRVRP